jgi:hypothetical protein
MCVFVCVCGGGGGASAWKVGCSWCQDTAQYDQIHAVHLCHMRAHDHSHIDRATMQGRCNQQQLCSHAVHSTDRCRDACSGDGMQCRRTHSHSPRPNCTLTPPPTHPQPNPTHLTFRRRFCGQVPLSLHRACPQQSSLHCSADLVAQHRWPWLLLCRLCTSQNTHFFSLFFSTFICLKSFNCFVC